MRNIVVTEFLSLDGIMEQPAWTFPYWNDEIARFNKFQGHVLQVVGATKIATADLDVRAYAKYVLREGSVSEKRELLGNLRSRLVYEKKSIRITQMPVEVRV